MSREGESMKASLVKVTIRLNRELMQELKRAAYECSDADSEQLTPARVAGQAVESYLASRRLDAIDRRRA